MRLPPHAGAAAQSAGRYQPGRTNASDCAAHPDRRARGTRHARAKRPFAPHHARRRTGDSDRTKQAMSGAQYRRHRRSGWSAHGAVLEFFSRRDSIGKLSERVPAIRQRRHYTVIHARRPDAQIVQQNRPRSLPCHRTPSPATPISFNFLHEAIKSEQAASAWHRRYEKQGRRGYATARTERLHTKPT